MPLQKLRFLPHYLESRYCSIHALFICFLQIAHGTYTSHHFLKALVESYRAEVTQEIQREDMTSGGQTIEQPPPKHPRVECVNNLSNSSGCRQ